MGLLAQKIQDYDIEITQRAMSTLSGALDEAKA